MRALKWILGGAAALALVVMLAGYIYLSGMDFNSIKPKLARAVEQGTGRKLTMAGDIKLSISLSPSLVVEKVSLANAPWGKRPQMISVQKAEVQVELLPLVFGGRLEINRLILDRPDILLEVDKNGRSNLDMEPVKPAPGKSAVAKAKPKDVKAGKKPDSKAGPDFSLDFKKVLIQNGRLELDDRKSGKKADLALDKLTLDSNGPDSKADIEINGSIAGKKFKAEGEFKPAGILTGQLDRPLDLKLAAQALGLKLKLDGKVKDPRKMSGIKLGVELASTGLVELADERLKGGFKFKAELSDPGPKAYRLDNLELKAGKTGLKGKLAVDLGSKAPAVKAELKAETLDLEPFLGSGGQGKKARSSKDGKPAGKGKSHIAPAKAAGKAPAGQRVFSAQKLDLDPLRKFDLDLKFGAEKVITGKLALQDLSVDLVLQKGKLTLKPARAGLADGALKMAFSLDAARPGKAELALDLALDKVNLAKFFDEMKMNRPLEGRLESQVVLKGSGGSVAAVMAGLDGRLAAVVKDGRLHKNNMNLLGAELASGLGSAFGNLLKNKQYTDLDCLILGFAVNKGMAKSTAIAMQTSEMIMLGNGTIDLKTEGIDLAFKPRPRKGLAETGVTLSLGELVRPFKLGGTLANPGLVLDEKEVAKTLGKALLGVGTYGTAGLLFGLASTGGEIKELCRDAALAAKEGKPYKPRHGEKKAKEGGEAASGEQKKEAENPAQAIEKGVGGMLKGILGRD